MQSYPPRRRPRSSRIAYPLLFTLLFFLCVGLAAATEAPLVRHDPQTTLSAPFGSWAGNSPAPTVASLNGTPLPPDPATPLPTNAPTPSVTPSPRPTVRFVGQSMGASPDCSRTMVRGVIHDGLAALNGVRVRVWWPDAPPDQLFSNYSGDRGDLGAGGYEVRLADGPRAGWWLVAAVDEQGALLSDALVVETTEGGCGDGSGRQALTINFWLSEGAIGVAGATLTPLPPTVSTLTPAPVPAVQPTPYPTPDGVERALKVPILMYHYISVPPPGSDRTRRDLSVGPDIFRAQLVTLREQGYTSITLSQLLYAIQQGGPLPPKPVVLTFDDGYRDNYLNAFPIMKEEGFVGTFFIITNPVEERNNSYMTWEQVVEMKEAGMEIGSHTLSHPALPGQSSEKIWQELVISRAILEQRLGQEVRTFAYPFGRLDPGVAHLAHEAGYWAAVTTRQGVTHTSGNLMSLRRIRVRGGMFPQPLLQSINYWLYEAQREP